MDYKALTKMDKNILYHLREKHPVINAVGKLLDGDTAWLLLIQVSLSEYAKHESKAVNLNDSVTGREKMEDPEGSNWLTYYRKISKCMYVYISPKQISSDTQSPYEILSTGLSTIQTRTTKLASWCDNLCMGLDSDTHRWIKSIVSTDLRSVSM